MILNSINARMQDYWVLAKPRVVMLISFTAAIGAALAALHQPTAPLPVLLSLVGITLVASSAAAFNCLVEAYIDVSMKRTRLRPLPAGRISAIDAACFSAVLGVGGIWLTANYGGALAAYLTAATFFGYAIVYTLYLKHATPQNIVIGGASGAMPPVLGWVSVSDSLTFEPLLLFLIIFVWTPPHFWALAIYRSEDYARANLPMLPVTHGKQFTATHIVLYSVALLAVSLLPYASGMAGVIYLFSAVVLGGRFCQMAWRLRQTIADADGRRLFSFSITYLALLFTALFIDAFAAHFGIVGIAGI
ncbi:MAG: heme o synthase [Gammaproteobacteria bacterium WSBS_2016_MAG_OTU1]